MTPVEFYEDYCYTKKENNLTLKFYGILSGNCGIAECWQVHFI